MSQENESQLPAAEPADEHSANLTGHVYDGIEEYDNPTQGWWNWLFIGSIFFSIAYLMVFEIGTAPDVHKQYETAFADNLRTQFAEIGDLAANEATIVKYMNDDEWIKVGEVTYKGSCASCHGSRGEGLVGPTMTADFYKNVKTVEDIAKIINEGAANGAMPAWQNRLHPNEVVLTAAYIANLRGTDPGPNAKKSEGEKIGPWPSAIADVDLPPEANGELK